jgi:hypothetical protein
MVSRTFILLDIPAGHLRGRRGFHHAVKGAQGQSGIFRKEDFGLTDLSKTAGAAA